MLIVKSPYAYGIQTQKKSYSGFISLARDVSPDEATLWWVNEGEVR